MITTSVMKGLRELLRHIAQSRVASETSQTSSYFRKKLQKAPSWMFDWVLNTPLKC